MLTGEATLIVVKYVIGSQNLRFQSVFVVRSARTVKTPANVKYRISLVKASSLPIM